MEKQETPCVFDLCGFNVNYKCTCNKNIKCYVKKLEEELNKLKLQQIKEDK